MHSRIAGNLNKCVFLDRDGVINKDRGDYTFLLRDFEILEGVIESIHSLKKAGYLIVVVTNQAGISKGLYTRHQMQVCHDFLQEAAGNAIDAFYHCPYHPTRSQSLARKPGTLMLEKAIARFHIATGSSWMVGDAERDIESGKKMGLKTIRIMETTAEETAADYRATSLHAAVHGIIL